LIANGRTLSIAVFASMGGLVYGYNQGLSRAIITHRDGNGLRLPFITGMFGQVLSMTSFKAVSGVNGISDPTIAGLLTSILELGAWIGVLANGILADRLGRKLCVVIACVFFCLGVIVQACTRGGSYSYILAGRFVF
jgi:MFS family permease